MKKVLSPTAFIVLVIAISANILYWLYGLISSLIVFLSQDIYHMLEQMGYGGIFDEAMIDAIVGFVMFFLVVVYAWALCLNGYFLFRLLRNRTIPQGQGYLVFMFVLHIIGIIFNGIGIMGGIFNPSIDLLFTLLVLGINIMVIVGYSIQRNYARSQTQPYDGYNGGYNNGYGNNHDNNNGFIDSNSYINTPSDPFSLSDNPYNNPANTDNIGNEPNNNDDNTSNNNGNPSDF